MSIHSSTVPAILNEAHLLSKLKMHLLTDNIDYLSHELHCYLKNAGKEEFDDELECKEEINFDSNPTVTNYKDSEMGNSDETNS